MKKEVVIYASCPRGQLNNAETKRNLKKLEKVLDKWMDVWYHIKVASESERLHNFEKFEKKVKKFLTNERECGKLKKLCDEKRKLGTQWLAQKNLKKLEKSS